MKITFTLLALCLTLGQSTWADTSRQDKTLHNLINQINSISRPGNMKISRCAVYSYLMGEILKLKKGNIRKTMSAASLYFSDAGVMYGKMSEGAKRLAKVGLTPISRSILNTLLLEWNARLPSNQKWTRKHFSEIMQLDDHGQVSSKTYALIEDHLTGNIPSWLSRHNARSETQKNFNDCTGDQIPAYGYRKDKEDKDGTGRHDHLLGNMLLGYSTEMLALIEDNRCLDLPQTVPHGMLFLSFKTVALLNRSVALAAPLADEYLDLNQNGSSTDVKVNKEGIKLGQWLAQEEAAQRTISVEAFNAKIFKAICDESELPNLSHYGPLTPKTLNKLLAKKQ